MFTGIISGLGQITRVDPLGPDASHGARLTVHTPAGYLANTTLGDSIAINGACMTVTAFDPQANWFTLDISAESLRLTAGLGQPGPVNLEKALRAHDRLGGHIVSGHVDGLGVVSHFAPVGESWELRVVAPQGLAKYLAYKGSITVNGVSLTVNRVVDGVPMPAANGMDGLGCEFSINLIPHTVAHTTLGLLRPGGQVNLEIDTVARYVERMLSAR
jgi:riboflavin synthase